MIPKSIKKDEILIETNKKGIKVSNGLNKHIEIRQYNLKDLNRKVTLTKKSFLQFYKTKSLKIGLNTKGIKECSRCGYRGKNFLKGFLICNKCVRKYNLKK